MKSRVFVTQKSSQKNYSRAAKFGRIIFILQEGTIYDANKAKQDIEDVFKKEQFDPETDKVVLSGDPLAIGLVLFVTGKCANKLNILKWDKQSSDYYPIEIDNKR